MISILLCELVPPTWSKKHTNISRVKYPGVKMPNKELLMHTYIVPALHFL